MKFIVGIVVGLVIYHYFPTQTRDLAGQVGNIAHQGALKAADLTRQ